MTDCKARTLMVLSFAVVAGFASIGGCAAWANVKKEDCLQHHSADDCLTAAGYVDDQPEKQKLIATACDLKRNARELPDGLTPTMCMDAAIATHDAMLLAHYCATADEHSCVVALSKTQDADEREELLRAICIKFSVATCKRLGGKVPDSRLNDACMHGDCDDFIARETSNLTNTYPTPEMRENFAIEHAKNDLRIGCVEKHIQAACKKLSEFGESEEEAQKTMDRVDRELDAEDQKIRARMHPGTSCMQTCVAKAKECLRACSGSPSCEGECKPKVDACTAGCQGLPP